MTDKELIKQEIEYRLSSGKYSINSKQALEDIIVFIDSLPEEPIVKGITWEDVNTLDTLIDQVRYEFPNGISEKSFGLAVLEKFQDYQDDIEEPASGDLEEELNTYIESKFTIDKEQLDRFGIKPEDYTFSLDKEDMLNFACHFAEWQKQKDFQDFMEKAEMYLKTRVYYNMHPNNVTTAIQEFKNYMKDE